MEKTVLQVPKMWADHHVLKVREVLAALDGVEDIYASAAWKQVVVKYDSARLDETAIVEALVGAGYGTDGVPELEGTRLKTGDPAWDRLGVRATRTNPRDLELSGEFRRY
jgi:copper chaperone CopZ